ncbi:hypothetical protein [Leptolyngbya sp. FACHB-261]|uniref:hypothetical protein n=1 Tax=Leptolyngbya sp. FACHB-261 TaxID=2692806 RepID=UPI0016873B86|nr:hypothetical protein [Leptolyngbya sp. FACHB-261]MBD2103965.1 hypothetical protein [Leptolyngbya sp. FACHB-261]
MTSQKLKHAVGILPNRRDAEQALIELRNESFPMHKISMITKTSDSEVLHDQGVQQHSLTRAEGAKAGAVAGSTGAGLLTLVVGCSILLVPGIGPALAIETLLATFLGSGTAAAVGGLYGAFQGWLVPKEQARVYNDRFDQGDCLVIIEAIEDEVQMAASILSRWGIQMWRVYDSV